MLIKHSILTNVKREPVLSNDMSLKAASLKNRNSIPTHASHGPWEGSLCHKVPSISNDYSTWASVVSLIRGVLQHKHIGYYLYLK